MSINFHDANNKYTYANRNAHISWQETINNIVDVQNKQVIDIGCGGGIYTKELALMGAKNVVGLDFSKEILQAAKENCNAFPNISFIHGDAHNIHSLMKHSTLSFLVQSFIICMIFLHLYERLLVY